MEFGLAGGGRTALRRLRRWLAFWMCSAAALTAALTAVLVLDSVRSLALYRPDPPTTSVVDHAITWARFPQREARSRSTDPQLVEQCRRSRFVVVTFSGTGMEDSHYQANMLLSPVTKLGGCVMYHWYGSTYDAHASARSVTDALRSVTAEGERKEVVFLGASLGGIAAEDIASDPGIRSAQGVHLRKVIMIATPVDLNDVIVDVFGVPVPLIKDVQVPIPRFGDLVVLGNAINGQRQRGDLGDAAEWRKTLVNAPKTRSQLMWSELERLRTGMRVVRADVPVDYVGSPDSDATVNTDQAYERVANLVTAETRYLTIEGGGHDQGWLLASADIYNARLVPILEEMFGAPA